MYEKGVTLRKGGGGIAESFPRTLLQKNIQSLPENSGSASGFPPEAETTDCETFSQTICPERIIICILCKGFFENFKLFSARARSLSLSLSRAIFFYSL